MRRIAIAVGFGLALALAACGGHEEVPETARQDNEPAEATVERAQPAGAAAGGLADERTEATIESARPAGTATDERTEVTVESAEIGEEPAEE